MKLIIISLIVLSGIVLFVFALFPSEVSVTQFVLINAPVDSVRRTVADVRTWKNWNELVKQSVKGGNGSDSSVAKFDSISLRSENLTILLEKVRPDSIVSYWQDRRGKSFIGKFVIGEANGQTMLAWTMDFHLHWYPWEKMASMFYDRQLSPVMQVSLVDLRNQLERH